MEKTSTKFLALGGVAGPVLFTITTVVCAAIRPGYSHIHDFISELGATGTPHAYLLNWMGFIPSGLMLAAFGWSLLSLLPKKIPARLGSVFVIIFGLGMTTVGFFSCDEGCPREGSLENNIHDSISGPIFICGILGVLFLGFAFRRLAYMKPLWLYSVISAGLSIVFLLSLINSFDSGRFTGTWQRLLILTLFLWFGIVGWRVFRYERSGRLT